MPPRWIHRLCLLALLTGLGVVVAGPMLVSAIVDASVDATLSAEELQDPALRQQAREQGLEKWRSRYLMLVPAATGMIFFGVIGLLFVWVTRLAESSKPTQ